MRNNKSKWHYLLLAGITVLFTIAGLGVGLFWDNVLFVGKTGTFLYENGIFNWFDMPVSQYTAHPYLCGTYYAAMWRLFGRSLLVSHLATMPVVFGVLYQLWNLCAYFIADPKRRYAAFLLVCAGPTLCAHCVQIGQELFILFFALYALNAILRQEHGHKALALCFLPLFSLRAMMLCAGLFLTERVICAIRSRRFWTVRTILSYAGGAMLSMGYLMLRYKVFSDAPSTMHTGYFDYSSVTQIAYTFVRNCAVMALEYADYGQIVLLITAFVIIVCHRGKLRQDVLFKELVACACLTCSVIIAISLFTLNQFAHHYFLLSFEACILLAFYVLQYIRRRKGVYTLLLVSLIAGNFIVYPEYKAQAWQDSLAHLPYWSIRRQAIQEMDSRHIPMEQTATFFPNACANDFIELNGDRRSFCAYTGEEEYLFYSSCYNPADDEITFIHSTYEALFTKKKGLVWVQVLKRKTVTP